MSRYKFSEMKVNAMRLSRDFTEALAAAVFAGGVGADVAFYLN
jgi:hypothetical protein